MHEPTNKRFSVRETKTNDVVAGLESVSAENANLQRLQFDCPLSLLAVGVSTYGRRGSDVFVRVADAEGVSSVRRDAVIK